MSVRAAAPIVVGGMALALALLALFGLLGVVTGVLGPILVLVAPGAAAGLALFPRGTLDRAERVLVSLVGSVVVAIVLGFLMTRIGIRLTPISWTVALALVTVGGIAGAVIRVGGTRSIHVPDRIAVPTGRSIPRLDLRLVAVAALVTLSAAGIARLGASAQPEPGFTQLWLLPGAGDALRIGVADEEAGPVTYRLVLRSATGTIAEWKDVRLAPGQRWERSVTVPAAARGSVELLLYRADSPGIVYRRVGLPSSASPAPSAAAPASAAPSPRPGASAAARPSR